MYMYHVLKGSFGMFLYVYVWSLWRPTCRTVATKFEVVRMNYSAVAILGESGGMPLPQEDLGLLRSGAFSGQVEQPATHRAS